MHACIRDDSSRSLSYLGYRQAYTREDTTPPLYHCLANLRLELHLGGSGYLPASAELPQSGSGHSPVAEEYSRSYFDPSKRIVRFLEKRMVLRSLALDLIPVPKELQLSCVCRPAAWHCP